MKIFYTTLFLLLTVPAGLLAQADITVDAPNCLGSGLTFMIDGQDATGRNTFAEQPDGMGNTVGVAINYDIASGAWVISERGMPNNIIYTTGPNTFSPNPPDSNTQSWEPTTTGPGNFCTGTGPATVTGPATQTMAGGDPCALLGGDSDNDLVCDDNDQCPGENDNDDMDMDGFPDACDPNPMDPDGVLLQTACLGPDPVLLTLIGNDGTRNIYGNTAFSLQLSFNATDMQWQVVEVGGQMQILYTSDTLSAPNPPSTMLSDYEGGGFCALDDITVTGTGTQNVRCLNVCDDGDDCTVDVQADDCTCTSMPEIENPVIVCRDTVLQLDLNGSATLDFAELIVSISDNCAIMDTAFLFPGANDFDCQDVTDMPIVQTDYITATDVNGNSASCSPLLQIQDTIPFTVDCEDPFFADITLACRQDLPAVDLDAALALAMDNCENPDLATSALTIIPGNAGCPEDTLTISRTYTYRDGSSPDLSCMQTVTIISENGPTIVCPADSLIDCGATPVVDAADATATFECSNQGNSEVTVSGPVIEGAVDSAGTTYTFTYSVTDFCGRTATCDQVFTVQDTIAPQIVSCVTDTTIYLDASGVAAIAPGELLVTTDNCAGPTEMVGDPLVVFDCTDVGQTFTYNETDIDVAGNESDVCTINVTVLDTLAPLLSCQAVQVALDENGAATLMDTAAVLLSLSDNCTDSTDIALTLTVGDLNCDIGTTTGDLTVTDAVGNSSNCTFSITVVDTLSPTITCSAVAPIVFVGDDCAFRDSPGMLTIEDNCGNPVTLRERFVGPEGEIINDTTFAFVTGSNIIGTGNAFPPGVSTITEYVTDGSGLMDSCTFTLTVRDSTSPVIVCRDTTILLDEDGLAELTMLDLLVSAQDNCTVSDTTDNVGLISLSCADIASGPISFPDAITIADLGANEAACTVSITVLDTLAPVSTATDTTLYLDEDGLATLAIADFQDDVADNCGTATVIDLFRLDTGAVAGATNGITAPAFLLAQEIMFDCSDAGMDIPVEIVAEDAFGNTSRDTIIVSILDTLSPIVTCMDTTVYLDDDGLASLILPGDLQAFTDNCADPDTVLMSDTLQFTCAQVGDTLMFPFTFTDASGNSATCNSSVSVLDTTPPAIVCQDLVVFLDSMGLPGAIDTVSIIAGVSDNCTDSSGIVVLLDLPLLDCFSDTNTASITATDASGNAGLCTFIVTVVDTLPPTAVCMDITVALADGMASIDQEIGSAIDGGSLDNCSVDSLTFSESVTEFTCDSLGANVVTLFVTDPSGLMDSCTAIVTVIDTTAPVVTVSDQTIVLTNGAPSITLTLEDLITAMDDCDATLTVVADRILTFGGADLGENAITVTITDAAGNVTTVTVLVIVGFEQPDLACITRVNVTLDDDCGFTLVPSQVLTGETALLDFFDFDLVVMDSDTTNGPIIDGCGSFSYKINDAALPGDLNDLDFPGCWGTVNAEDKTPPVLVETPFNVTGLLCVDVAANNVNALSAGVDKCFLVDGGGAIIAGSISDELLAVLSPDAFDDVSPDTALIPTFTDGCASEIEVCVSDIVTPSADGCGATVIERFFRAREASGCAPLNPNEQDDMDDLVASFRLTFTRPTLDSLSTMSIAPTVEIEACGDVNSPLQFVPRDEDYPVLTVDGRDFQLNDGSAMCSMVAVTYENAPNPIQTCANTVKFLRTYTVVDWCDPTNLQTFTQFVKVGDSTGPVFSGPSMTSDGDGNLDPVLTYRTNFGNECAALVRLDGPGVGAVDACDGSVVDMVVSIYPNGDLTEPAYGAYPIDLNNGQPELSDPLPVGTYAFQYTATDACGNATVTEVPFEVVDGNTPTAICEDGLNVSLSQPGGTATLTPAAVDKGSTDDCSNNLSYGIAYSNDMNSIPTDFADEITFTCADLGTQFVTLEVTDENENSNTCWLEVLVELKDGEVPTCIAPSAVTMTCTQVAAMLPTGLIEEATEAELDAAFGFATGVGTCETTVTSELVNNNLNECGIGTVVRNFQVTDGQGNLNVNSCTQLITVVGTYDYQIVLPGNARSNDCTDEFDTDELMITGGACDVPVVSTFTEEVFNTPGDECYQLRTTYTIINTCEYDPAFGGTTVITRAGLDVADTDPIYLNVQSRNAATEDDDIAFVSSSANGQLTPGADDDLELNGYAASTGRGSFTYVQTIDIFDRTAPTVDVTGPTECIAGCTADVTLPFTATDNCGAATVSLALDANYDPTTGFVAETVAGVVITLGDTDAENGNYTINATNVPAGDHAILITATDECGNATPVIVPVSVCGDVAPVPLCIQTITATLLDDGNGGGTAQVWARDFLTDSPLLDCFGNEVTKFGIVRAGEGPATVDLAGLTVSCADFGDLVEVEVYAFDEAGNEPEFCSVLIEIQEGDGVTCGTGVGNILGTISTQDDDPIANVMVTLTGGNDMDEMSMTAADGTFRFTNLPLGADYTVQPDHDVPVDLREVKISDVVKISSVILGTSTFDNPYDYVAADVDQSDNINVLDMVAIQRVILGLDETFRTGDSWLFVNGAHPLTGDNWMASFPEVYNANDLSQNLLDVDFVGVEMGNVLNARGRSSLYLETEDGRLESGQEHTITFGNEDLYGFQATLDLGQDLELLDVSHTGEGGLNLQYVGEGLIGLAIRTPGELTLTVRAINPVVLSEAIELTDDLVHQEGVNVTGGSTSLGLAFVRNFAPAAAQNALHQNIPNPVISNTVIAFDLAKAGPARLTVYDALGRLLIERKLNAVAGRNSVTLNKGDLGASGTLSYSLESGDFTATKQMIVTRR